MNERSNTKPTCRKARLISVTKQNNGNYAPYDTRHRLLPCWRDFYFSFFLFFFFFFCFFFLSLFFEAVDLSFLPFHAVMRDIAIPSRLNRSFVADPCQSQWKSIRSLRVCILLVREWTCGDWRIVEAFRWWSWCTVARNCWTARDQGGGEEGEGKQTENKGKKKKKDSCH